MLGPGLPALRNRMTGLQRSPGRRRGSGLAADPPGLFGDSGLRWSAGSPGCGATATGRRTGRRPSCRPADRRVPRARSAAPASLLKISGCSAAWRSIRYWAMNSTSMVPPRTVSPPDVGGAELLLDPDAHFATSRSTLSGSRGRVRTRGRPPPGGMPVRTGHGSRGRGSGPCAPTSRRR